MNKAWSRISGSPLNTEDHSWQKSLKMKELFLELCIGCTQECNSKKTSSCF